MQVATIARAHATLVEDGSDGFVGVLIDQAIHFGDQFGAVSAQLPDQVAVAASGWSSWRLPGNERGSQFPYPCAV